MKKDFTNRQKEFSRLMTTYLEKQDLDQRFHLNGPGTNSLAAWFLGPKAENQSLFSDLIMQGIDFNCKDRIEYFPNDPPYVTPERKDEEYYQSVNELKTEYQKLLSNLKSSVPFFSYRIKLI
jgi:hypothetical protein